MLQRRTFLTGLAAAIAAPYVVRNSGVLMPVKNRLIEPPIIHLMGWMGNMTVSSKGKIYLVGEPKRYRYDWRTGLPLMPTQA